MILESASSVPPNDQHMANSNKLCSHCVFSASVLSGRSCWTGISNSSSCNSSFDLSTLKENNQIFFTSRIKVDKDINTHVCISIKRKNTRLLRQYSYQWKKSEDWMCPAIQFNLISIMQIKQNLVYSSVNGSSGLLCTKLGRVRSISGLVTFQIIVDLPTQLTQTSFGRNVKIGDLCPCLK